MYAKDPRITLDVISNCSDSSVGFFLLLFFGQVVILSLLSKMSWEFFSRRQGEPNNFTPYSI